MKHLSKRCPFCFFAAVFLISYPTITVAEDDDGKKRLEEVVVYGQKNEMTVSDTSIAITAFNEDFLTDMGVQGPNELMNFIPATTRTDWDVKIRGVGRNFRSLGGDPGVGTYYNGAYSPDFGIASTEGALYDIKRIEVLRGPQGTLYGRNSIGGVINYVTNQPNHDAFEASTRVQLGRYNTKELFGFVTGPVTDSLAYRLVGVQRNRDGAVEGIAGSQDVEGVHDRNFALTLDWNVTDKFSVNVRANDRHSKRAGNFGNGGHGITSEGPCIGQHPITSPSQCDPRYRVSRDTNHYAGGFRGVSEDYFNTYGDLADDPKGAAGWIHPATGATHYGAYNRPGVDNTDKWPFMPTAGYQNSAVAAYSIGDAKAPDIIALTNDSALEQFDHQAGTLSLDWDLSDTLSMSYILHYSQFVYYFNRDNDFSSGLVSDNNDTVVEDVDNYSHEFRIFWELGDRWTATTGFYNFWEDRQQLYGIRDRAAQGRATDAALYGPEGHETLLIDALAMAGWIFPGCMDYRTVPINGAQSVHPGYGAYCGDAADRVAFSQEADVGGLYEHDNSTENENIAFYTQGDLRLTDTLSVTLGVRYSKDTRKVLEQRGGYSEIEANQYSGWLPGAINLAIAALHPDLYDTVDQGMLGDWGVITGVPAAAGPGVNGLAALNVAMGNATWSGDPDFPITPVCELTAETCAHPLRLHGIPISWGHRTRGEYKPSSEWTYRVNFNWEPSDDILVYFGATSGYRAGGFGLGEPDNRAVVDTDGIGACVPGDDGGCDLRVLLSYEGESITSYELGYKGTHLDGLLQVNVALYYYDYRDYQDRIDYWEESEASFSLPNLTLPDGTALGAPSGRGPVAVTANIPKAVNKGFEIDGLYLWGDNFMIGGNYSYTSSKYDAPYTFFNDDDPRYPRNVFGGDLSENPCNMAAEIKALYCIEINGYQLQGIPKHKATAWASYDWNFSLGTLTLLGSYSYTGDYSTNPFSRPWDQVPERDRFDLRLAFREASGHWSASLFVDNVFDDTYIRESDMDIRRTGYGPNWPQRVVALYPRYVGFEMTYNMGAY
jgi:outer membrane receptor protein involved in Fe transport|tara:strand:- start:106 stop:3273 length:3168 start_codon:yes stop_codon:yes gene_type:complete